MSIRIQLSHATVKALHSRLQDAYRKDDVRLVRRISVLLDLLTQKVSVAVLCERWGLSPSCLYDWQKALMLRGMDSLIFRHSGGRPEQLTPRQNKRLVELIEAGPLVVGFSPTRLGSSVPWGRRLCRMPCATGVRAQHGLARLARR